VRLSRSYLLFAGVIVLLLVLRPLSTSANVPLVLLLAMGAAVLWFAGYYGLLYIRAKSVVVITESAMRQSASTLQPLAETDLGGDPFPPQSLYLVGGGAWGGTSISDKDALFVPKASTERFARKALLIYSPTQPIPGALLAGLAAHEHDQAVRTSFSGFIPKGDSLLHFSLLDSLHGQDSQRLREEQAFIVDKYARLMAETRRWAHQGGERFIKEIRVLAAAMRKSTPKETAKKLFFSSGDDETTKAADAERIK